MNYFILFLSFPMYLLLYRQILPLYWYINRLFDYRIDFPYLQVAHISYLIFQIFGVLIVFKIMISSLQSKKIFKTNFSIKEQRLEKRIFFWLSLFLFTSLLILGNDLPLLSGLNSDTIVKVLYEDKLKNFLGFGLLAFCGLVSLLLFVFYRGKLSIIYFAITIFCALAVTKKSTLLILLLDFVFVAILLGFYFSKKNLVFLLVYLIAFISLGILILIQTVGINFSSIYSLFELVLSIYYASSTSFLNIMWDTQGINLAESYRDNLGVGGAFSYLLNPVLKVLGVGGIEQGIGTYLTENIYGSDGQIVLRGVNPTLFFEFIFIFGEFWGMILAFLFIGLLYLGLIYTMQKIVYSKNLIFMDLVFYWILIKFLFSVQFDILNVWKSTALSLGLLVLLRVLVRFSFRTT